MNVVPVMLGEKLFEFTSKQDWVNKGPRIWRVYQATDGRAISIDAKGRIVQTGAEFARAEKDGAYPVSVYRVQLDSPLNGADPKITLETMYGDCLMDNEY
jgi:hypothetical protein